MSVLLKNGQYSYDAEKDVLGKGSFGKVYRGKMVKTGMTVAIKMVSLQLIKQMGEDFKEIIKNQVKLLKELSRLMTWESCPFIIRIYDCFLTENNICMILEYCDEGNMTDILKSRGRLPEAEAVEIIYHVVRALDFLSKLNVTHRDLKPDNVFLKKVSSGKNNQNLVAFKLGDFGFAVKSSRNRDTAGTYPYMSPEMYRLEEYGSEVDVWALGIIANELLFGQNPYLGKSKAQIKQLVLFKPYTIKAPNLVSPSMADFLYRCICKPKRDRLRSNQLIKHPVFKQMQQKYKYIFPTAEQLFEIQQDASLKEQQLIKDKTVKNQITFGLENELNKAIFFQEIGRNMLIFDRHNFSSIMLIKECLVRLQNFKKAIQKGINLSNFDVTIWKQFADSKWFSNFSKYLSFMMQCCKMLFDNEWIVYEELLKTVTQSQKQPLRLRVGAEGQPPTRIQIDYCLEQWAKRLQNSQQISDKVLMYECLLAINIDSRNYDFGDHLKKRMTYEPAVFLDLLQKQLH